MARLPRGRDRGAVAPLVAVMLTLMITSAAFAVDLGMQRVVRSDMQALADVVALDLARELDGRSLADLNAALPGAIARSRQSNEGSALGDVTGLTATWGAWNGTTWVPGVDPPTAVKVVASGSVAFAFAPGEGGASRTAYAAATTSGCHKVGSWAADLRTGSSILGPVLNAAGTNVELRAVSYAGLATAQVTLQDLATQISAGIPEQALGTSLQVGTFLDYLVTVLGPDTAAAGVLNTQFLGRMSAALKLKPIKLGDLVTIAGAPSAALSSTVNVLDLVQGALLVANGTNAIAVPGISVGVGNLKAVTVSAHVIQKPQIACGIGSTANTSQITLRVGGNLNATLPKELADAEVFVEVKIASAASTLRKITCTDGRAVSMAVDLSTPALAQVTSVLEVYLASGVRSTVRTQGSGGTASQGAHLLELPANYDVGKQSGSGTLVVADIEKADISVLGLDLGGLLGDVLGNALNPLTNTVQGVLRRLEDALVGEVFPALGLRVAGADMFGVRTPTCAQPLLTG
ncbi:hypothetical protein NOK12_05350 [Nocardioides sp. OK12]|uniref:pilus assembly protein TadG-related protein n=1 Tax=Nocardioides sp. OK12 TaxID=2758661 RepID=UPI0021C2A249|nr:pilus assembly protein TadG-related protein [Nocardioides sp. OK12]GHJ58016.1 hypothetical protein NOK12_05350 [Nocardioides sp. OK12]